VKRRRATSRKPAKARQTIKAKRVTASKPARNRDLSALSKDTKVARLARELREAREQQAATSQVLQIISTLPGELQPVFDAIVASGLKLFPGATVLIALVEGDQVKAAAVAAPDAAGIEGVRRRMPFPLTREYITSTAILDRRIVDICDAKNVPKELAIGARNSWPLAIAR
jgi:hypothetical protein